MKDRTTKTLIMMLAAAAWLAPAGAARAQHESAKPVRPTAGAPMRPDGYAPRIAPKPPQQPPKAPDVMPPPAPEVVAAAKVMRGRYRCKGFVMNPDGSSRPSVSSLKISSELDGYWILVDMAEQRTRANPHPFKARMYRTYDGQAHAWKMVILSVGGQSMTQTSTDTPGSAMTWTGTGAMGGMHFTERAHEEPDARHRTVHLWGEASMDGRHFMKEYDVTCKR
jgi:hypothetical protein